MKVLPVLLGALLLAAPAVAVCSCAKPAAPIKAAMGCEGTAHCCCPPAGTSKPADCPRAEKSVEPGEIQGNSTEPVPAVDGFPALPALVFERPAPPARPDDLSRASPPSHHLTLTALLI